MHKRTPSWHAACGQTPNTTRARNYNIYWLKVLGALRRPRTLPSPPPRPAHRKFDARVRCVGERTFSAHALSSMPLPSPSWNLNMNARVSCSAAARVRNTRCVVHAYGFVSGCVCCTLMSTTSGELRVCASALGKTPTRNSLTDCSSRTENVALVLCISHARARARERDVKKDVLRLWLWYINAA